MLVLVAIERRPTCQGVHLPNSGSKSKGKEERKRVVRHSYPRGGGLYKVYNIRHITVDKSVEAVRSTYTRSSSDPGLPLRQDRHHSFGQVSGALETMSTVERT